MRSHPLLLAAIAPAAGLVIFLAATGGCSANGSPGQPAGTDAALSRGGLSTLPGGGVATAPAPSTTTTRPAPSTTLGKFTESGVKQPLPGGGTVAIRNAQQTSTPAGAPPPPAGHAYAVVVATFCAPATAPTPPLDPASFQVEVPGDGFVGHTGAEPPIGRAPMVKGLVVPAGMCADATVGFVIGGELHVESANYLTPAGPLRWAF